jgi:hypothetical protein
MSRIALTPNASGTGTFTIAAPGTNTDRTLTLPDASGTLARTADIPSVNPFTLGTAVASTSGTAIDFTGIPSWAKRVTVMFSGVSLSGTTFFTIRLGTSGGIETTGYLSASSKLENTTASVWDDSSFVIYNASNAGNVLHGSVVFTQLTGNSWVCSGVVGSTSGAFFTATLAGRKTLAATLDRIRITTYNGTDTFDAGTINISYEG